MKQHFFYISPEVMIINVQSQKLLAGSGPKGGDGGGSTPGVGSSRRQNSDNVWDDEEEYDGEE